MIDKQVSVERFTFSCLGCRHTWTVDYGVQYVQDGHGHTGEYFLRNGLPVVNPSSRHAVLCPCCGRDLVHAHATPRPAQHEPRDAPPGSQAQPPRF